MSLAVVLNFVKAILPKTKIGAWISGLLVLGVAAILSADPKEILVKMCASELPPLPQLEAPAPAVEAPKVLPEKK